MLLDREWRRISAVATLPFPKLCWRIFMGLLHIVGQKNDLLKRLTVSWAVVVVELVRCVLPPFPAGATSLRVIWALQNFLYTNYINILMVGLVQTSFSSIL